MEKLSYSVYEISDSIEELINEGSVIPLYVSGSSMNPFLVSRRDIVYLTLPEKKDIQKGKILLFRRSNGALVLHRVMKVCNDDSLIFCGDAQTACEKVKKTQVIAAVSEVERKGKRKSADSFAWRFWGFVWRMLKPIRPVLMRLWLKFVRIRNIKHPE